MTDRQRLELRRSEIQSRLLEIGRSEELTDELRTESRTLQTELADVETRWRALAAAEPAPVESREDAEGREIRALSRRASVTEYFSVAHGGGVLAGAPAELNAALGVGERGRHGGILVPFEALESRAAGPTTTGDHDGPVTQRPIQERLFATPVSMAAGVRFDQVPVGRAEAVVMTAGLEPAMSAEGASVAGVKAEYAVTTLAPKALRGTVSWTHEFDASVPGAEDAIRRDATAVLASKMEGQIVSGTGAGNQLTGIVKTKGGIGTDANASAQTGFGDVAALAALGVDGIHASRQSDVSVIIPPGAYKYMAKQFQTTGERSALQALEQVSGGVHATGHLADSTTTKKTHTGFLHSGMGTDRGDAVAVLWPVTEFLFDPLTKAGDAEILLTAIQLWNFAVLRADAYQRVLVREVA